MKNFFFLMVIFLISCSQNDIRNDFTPSDKMSFDEFRLKLEEYVENNPYPKIDD